MKYLLSIIAALLLLSSCNKNLDLPPADDISNSQYWKTAQDLDAYVLQFYASLPTTRNSSGYTGYIGSDAYVGSDLQIRATPNPRLNGNRSPVNSAAGTAWNFVNIRSVNIFFENYKNVNEPFVNIRQYVGEAHFFKAWFYFNLVKAYGDVPWYTNSMLLDDERLFDPRTPRTQVVDSILMHLDSAVSNLNFLKDLGTAGSNRLSKEAALIFKSRVGLFEGTWQKYHSGTDFATPNAQPTKYLQACVDAVNELRTPGKYKVGLNSTYSGLFNQTNLSSVAEVVLWCKYDRTLGFAHNFQQFVTLSTDEVSATMQQVQNYLKADGKPYNYLDTGAAVKGTAFLSKIANECDPRLKQIIWIPGQNMWNNAGGVVNFAKPNLDKTNESKNFTGFQMSKGADPRDPTAGGAQGFSTSCETASIIFRYGEALLNLAEAQAELGQTVDYVNTINLLRSRVSMPAFAAQADATRTSYASFGYPLSDELYEIRRERAVELGCEGFRFDDWRRWAAGNLFKNKRPLGFPYLASEYPASFTILTTNGFVDPYKNLLPNGYNFNAGRDYLECVPVNERTLNPALTQNPGW
ncbi:RagB/SusD family nutrient uptake outer membrane protein [Niabella insulamsoli]|uniref:RagB/SusD family nutrient uptake outer membrane protein n=1 Tax=Niabella insulamsoli TaxID=3144874 RepID=UPI0031FD30F3